MAEVVVAINPDDLYIPGNPNYRYESFCWGCRGCGGCGFISGGVAEVATPGKSDSLFQKPLEPVVVVTLRGLGELS